MSLIYWQQNLHQYQKSLDSTSSLDGYMYIREIYQKSWNRKTITEWKQSYLVLRFSLLILEFFKLILNLLEVQCFTNLRILLFNMHSIR